MPLPMSPLPLRPRSGEQIRLRPRRRGDHAFPGDSLRSQPAGLRHRAEHAAEPGRQEEDQRPGGQRQASASPHPRSRPPRRRTCWTRATFPRAPSTPRTTRSPPRTATDRRPCPPRARKIQRQAVRLGALPDLPRPKRARLRITIGAEPEVPVAFPGLQAPIQAPPTGLRGDELPLQRQVDSKCRGGASAECPADASGPRAWTPTVLGTHRAGNWDGKDRDGGIDARALDDSWCHLAPETAAELSGDVAGGQVKNDNTNAPVDRVRRNSSKSEYRQPGCSRETGYRAKCLAAVSRSGGRRRDSTHPPQRQPGGADPPWVGGSLAPSHSRTADVRLEIPSLL